MNAPAGTPRPIIERLNQEIIRVLALPEVRSQLAGQGVVVATGSSEKFGALIAAETEKWTRVVRSAGVKPE